MGLVPLQFGAPGGLGSVLRFVIWTVYLLPGPAVAGLLYWDCARQGNEHRLAWASSALMLGMLGTPIGALVVGLLYAVVTDRPRAGPATGDRLVNALVLLGLGLVGSFVLGYALLMAQDVLMGVLLVFAILTPYVVWQFLGRRLTTA